MRRSTLVGLTLLASTALAAWGCDGAGGGAGVTTPDAVGGGSDVGPATGDVDPSRTRTPAQVVEPVVCSREGFTASVDQLTRPTPTTALYRAASGTAAPYDLLEMEFRLGQPGAGSYVLTGANHADCANCVRISTGCDGATCQRTFYASEGRLNLEGSDLNGYFKGLLQSVVLREVILDAEGRSTEVVDGEVWCLDAYPFELGEPPPEPVGPVDPSGPPPIRSGEGECAQYGTGSFVGDKVANFGLTNCNGQTVYLHGTCGQRKALWVMATAGWCTACASVLAQLTSNYGGSLSRDGLDERTPGLDMIIVLGEDNYGNKPTTAYCKAYAQEHKLDPTMVLIDHSDAAVNIPLWSPKGYALPINSLAITWSYINPYLTANSSGSVQTAYPWMAALDGWDMRYVMSDYFEGGDVTAALNSLLAAP